MHTEVRRFGEGQGFAREFRAGVSIHIHTRHSRESLEFLKRFCERTGLVQESLQEKPDVAERKIQVDLSKAYWRPPLGPLAVFDAERRQVEDRLGLQAMMSITDHDCIDGPMRLSHEDRAVAPISLEWTVPFRRSAFHLGVHNLPMERAEKLFGELIACKAKPAEEQALDLLQTLHAIPSTLVVLNHPLWNLRPIPWSVYEAELESFLERAGAYVHALEVNGLRTWGENAQVMALASHWRKPAVSGGDRHGCELNANLNLTNASSFSEWVQEIREQQSSHILLMPQYGQARPLRLYRTFLDAIREYPAHPEGQRCWDERTYHPDCLGTIRPVASLWRRVPAFLEVILGVATFAEGTLLLKTIESFSARNGFRLLGIAEQEGYR